ncbi:MAG: hypothetical protein KY429_07240 [Actinobacteria bacterium]|nr:hypothetical protein [Actinomycetota bacterium]
MKWTMKLMVALVSVVMAALGTTAVAQTPDPESAPESTEEGQVRKADTHRRAEKLAHRGGKDGCGPAEPRDRAKRIVHSETKVRLDDGFGTRTLDVGEVTSVDGNQITIRRADGETVSATAAEGTRVCRDGDESSLENIESGDTAVLMQRTQDDGTQLKGVRAFSQED